MKFDCRVRNSATLTPDCYASDAMLVALGASILLGTLYDDQRRRDWPEFDCDRQKRAPQGRASALPPIMAAEIAMTAELTLSPDGRRPARYMIWF